MRINISFNDKESGETTAFSARELRGYLAEMLPEKQITINNNEITDNVWRISLSRSPSLVSYGLRETEDPSVSDQYVIHMDREAGHIIGSNERSVLLAVYRYVYLLGVRFLRPGREYEKVPVLESVDRLYLHEGRTASLRHRGVCIEGADSLENILDFVDWLPKLGYNCFFLQFKVPYAFLARWYHHELNPAAAPEPFGMAAAERCCVIVEKEVKKRGLFLHRAGHGWTGEVLGYPSSEWKRADWEPDEHTREMIAEVNGERELFMGIPLNTNLCYSNPAAVERFVSMVESYVLEHPETDYLHVWLADEYNNICECEACSRTTPTDQYVHILNLVDERLTQKRLKTKIVFLLYQELLWAPEKETFHNPDRFVLMFAPISRTFESSYRLKDGYGPIPAYKRNRITLPVNLDENMAYLRAWQEKFQGDSFVYDYPMGRAHYGDFGYVHISRVISQDIKQLGQMRMDGYISCQELRSALPNALPGYVMGETLFDTERSFEELTEEYFQAAYGERYREVIRYLETLSGLSCCDYLNGKGVRVDEKQAERLTRLMAAVEEFRPTIAEGAESAQGVEKLFWKHLDYHAEYSVGLGGAMRLLACGREEEAGEAWEAFQSHICEMEPEFQKCLDVYRVTEVTSKYTGFKLGRRLLDTL